MAAVWFAFISVVLILLVGGVGGFFYARGQLDAPSQLHSKTATIQVASGETLDQVASDLASRGLIRSQFWFSVYARYRGLGGELRAGQYLLDSGMGASAVITKLEGSPDIATVKIVLPEGLTSAQMASIIAKSQLHISATDYMALVQNPSGFTGDFSKYLPAGASLEGFLFPDTYDVPVNATAHEVIQMQLDAFAAKAAPHLSATQLSAYQVLIVASIIEKEAKFPADRPLVSSVIANRLAQGIRLQLDSTVLYGLGIVSQASSLTSAQLQEDTPYNTYLHAGLPPTPIANPGVDSLTAAANPSSTQYLFFIADCLGHVHYGITAQDQDNNIARYLSAPCAQ